MADGIGCKCFASYQGECACDADWTPSEVYELRANINALREALHLVNEHSKLWGFKIAGNVQTEIDAALSATPAESLQAFENEVIEKIINIIKSETDKFNNVDSLLYIIEILDNMKVNHETTKTP